MRLAALAGLLVSALLSSGCLVVGLHPFYEDDAIEFDEALVGEWENAEDQSRIRVERGPWRSYRITYTEVGDTEKYWGFLTRVGPLRLLDLVGCGVPGETPLVARVHVPLRLQLLGDALTLAPLDYGWFRDEAERGRPAALHPELDESGNVLFTAPTAAVRVWLAAHAPDRFDEPVRFFRRPAG